MRVRQGLSRHEARIQRRWRARTRSAGGDSLLQTAARQRVELGGASRDLKESDGSSDASTDAIGTLKSGAGVCRDFAHVGMALARALRIPARMVVGYLLGLEPMDLHAWFEGLRQRPLVHLRCGAAAAERWSRRAGLRPRRCRRRLHFQLRSPDDHRHEGVGRACAPGLASAAGADRLIRNARPATPGNLAKLETAAASYGSWRFPPRPCRFRPTGIRGSRTRSRSSRRSTAIC